MMMGWSSLLFVVCFYFVVLGATNVKKTPQKDHMFHHRQQVYRRLGEIDSRFSGEVRQEGDDEVPGTDDDGDSTVVDGEPDIKPPKIVGEYIHPRHHIFVYWVYDGDIVNFFVAAPTQSWFGIGFNKAPQMPKADVIVGGVEQYQLPFGVSEDEFDSDDLPEYDFYPVLSDRHVSRKAREMPILDEIQNVVMDKGSYVDGWSILEFHRLVNTTDLKYDLPLNEAKYMIWAVGGEEDYIREGGYGTFSHHLRRGMVEVSFPHGKASHLEDITKEEAHASLMMFAWGLFAVLTIFCARYMKDPLGSWWFILHAFFGIMIFCCTLAGFATIVDYVAVRGKSHFDSLHKVVGLIVVLGMLVQFGIGLYTRISFDPERQRPPIFPDKVHWWVGRLVAFAALTNIFSGLLLFDEAGDVPWVMVFIWFAIIIAYVALFEVYFRGDTPDRATVAKEYELLEKGVQVVRQNNSALLICFGSLSLLGCLLVALSVGLIEK